NDFVVGIDMLENYCWGDVADLTAIPVQGSFGSPAQFEWKKIVRNNDGNLTEIPVGSNSPAYTTETLTGDQIMLVRVISSEGCLEQRRDTINVYPQIGPYLIRDDHPFFSDSDLIAFRIDNIPNNPPDSTVISVLAGTEYPVQVRTQSASTDLSYAWDVPYFTPQDNKNSTLLIPSGGYESALTGTIVNQITGKEEQYIPMTCHVTSPFGCKETINLKARILDKIRMANVFSPNGDGINDLWRVPYADIFPNLEITIVNRWGAVVWSARASDASAGWDGKNKNGKDLPIGTYYYVISFNVPGSNHWKPISGSVTIVR
ncbi:MAG TPA: gliding motility-associated C-terminal domain-containing protein, partial [Bacteroidetes bacterium]|nr:gliding motility-associated C-terminal domain-containing protein [Bacteroidota bacterium]